MTPCLCGHPMHFGAPCACGCVATSPDYVAAAAPTLAVLSPVERERYEAVLRASQDEVAAQLRWGIERTVERTCAYCGRPFRAARPHARTCSGACRQALAVARTYATEADVPPASTRRDTTSAERARATGVGLVTAQEGYEADLRVVGMRLREEG